MKRILSLCILAALAASVLFIGCQPKGDVKIGAILELTGSLGALAQRSQRGMGIAVEEVNASGGIRGRKLSLLVEDTKSDPKEGTAAFLRMVETEHVQVVTGAIGSSTVMACAPKANEKKVVLFSAGATSPLITNAGDYVFRNRLSGIAEVKAMASYAYDSLALRRVAVLYINTDYGLGNKEAFVPAFTKLGGQVPVAEAFDQGATDFRTQLTKVRSAGVDGLYILAVAENGYIIKQAKEMGIKARLMSTVGIEGPDVWKVADSAANGVIYTVQKYDPSVSSTASHFREKYFSKYDEEPDLFSALGYDAIQILAREIKERGYSGEAIKAGLYALKNYQGAEGTVSFDQNGDIVSDVMMKVAQDGKFVPYTR